MRGVCENHTPLHWAGHLHGKTVTVGANIGLSLYPKASEDSEGLLRLADGALYVAKRKGNNLYIRVVPEKE